MLLWRAVDVGCHGGCGIIGLVWYVSASFIPYSGMICVRIPDLSCEQ